MSGAARVVLVVEDDAHISELVCLHLDLEGYRCEAVATGTEALKRLNERTFDLVVLDLMLPGVDGIAVCRAMRRQGPNRRTPVLMLTARREESDTVLGLESGADERPVSILGLELDPARRAVTVRGVAVDMTRQEFGLLYVLASSPGIVFSRERLLARVWQDQAFVTERSVDTLVKRVRRKIEMDPTEPRLLQTVWGDGYKFADG